MAVEPNNCIKITAMLPPPADKIGKCQQITSCPSTNHRVHIFRCNLICGTRSGNFCLPSSTLSTPHVFSFHFFFSLNSRCLLAGKGPGGLVTPNDDGFIHNCCQWERLCAARGEGVVVVVPQ